MSTVITINMNTAALGMLEQQNPAQLSEQAMHHLGMPQPFTTDGRTISTTSAQPSREHTEPAPIRSLKTIKIV